MLWPRDNNAFEKSPLQNLPLSSSARLSHHLRSRCFEPENPGDRQKGNLPVGTIVMHKTGTSGTRGGVTFATNDIGLITLPDGRRLAIAVFVTDSTADDDTRDAVIARIAKAAYDQSIHANK